MSRLTFFCDLAEATTPLPHFWEHTIGSHHARIALRSDWQRQLKRAHDELGFRYVRFHGLLSDDIGTLSRDNVYSFFNCDQIFDFLLTIGMKPFVELSFMPSALASGKRTVFSYEANVTVVLHRPVQDDWFNVDENSTGYFYNVTLNDTYRDEHYHVHDVIDSVTSAR